MSSEIIRVVLKRGNDHRTLLRFERKQEHNYYSYGPIIGKDKEGNIAHGHATYHESGETHISRLYWGPDSKFTHYENRRQDEKPNELTRVVKLQTLVFENNYYHHMEDSRLNKFVKKTKHNAEDILFLNEDQVSDGQIIVVINAIANDQSASNGFRDELQELQSFEILASKESSNREGNVMIVHVLKSIAIHGTALLEIKALLNATDLTRPEDNEDVSLCYDDGQTASYLVIKGVNFGKPTPFRQHPPYFPKIRLVGDLEHRLKIYSSPWHYRFTEVGDISIRAFHNFRMFVFMFQFEATKDIESSTSLLSSNRELASTYTPSFYSLEFVHGGHRVMQIEKRGKTYQIELESISQEIIESLKPKFESVRQPDLSHDEFDKLVAQFSIRTYEIKIIEVGSSKTAVLEVA